MILTQKTILTALTLSLAAFPAAAGIVRGAVYDKTTNEPLIGATVRVASSSTGTSTDIEGRYSLNIKEGKHSIIVSYIGYADTVVTAHIAPSFSR